MGGRQLVVVDTETTGLDLERHVAVEVAWWNLDTDEVCSFIPPHGVEDLDFADLTALRLNRYRERIEGDLQDHSGMFSDRLYEVLRNNTFVGSNPAFDAIMLRKVWVRLLHPEYSRSPVDPWHYRMLDLSAYAAGVLGVDPRELPGLREVCDRLDVHLSEDEAHGALADVLATGRCIKVLQELADRRRKGRDSGKQAV